MGGENKISSVLWNSPAFKAGLAPGMTLVGVNGDAASGDLLKDAVTEAAKTKAPIVLLVNDGGHLNTVTINYTEGLKYPHLERIAGTPDRLGAIHATKK